MMIPDDLIQVGYIMGAHGVRGQIKIRPYTQDSVLLSAKQCWLQRLDRQGNALEAPIQVQITQAKLHPDQIIASFKQCQDRDQAESLKGLSVFISREQFPTPEDDEYYWVDLEQCQVYSVFEGQKASLIGIVDSVSHNGAHAVLHLDRYELTATGELNPLYDQKNRPLQALVPFVKAHVTQVDLKNKRIEVDWPIDF